MDEVEACSDGAKGAAAGKESEEADDESWSDDDGEDSDEEHRAEHASDDDEDQDPAGGNGDGDDDVEDEDDRYDVDEDDEHSEVRAETDVYERLTCQSPIKKDALRKRFDGDFKIHWPAVKNLIDGWIKTFINVRTTYQELKVADRTALRRALRQRLAAELMKNRAVDCIWLKS